MRASHSPGATRQANIANARHHSSAAPANTGQPTPCTAPTARQRVASVSVLAPNCMWADAWATALLVLGDTAGLALAQRLGLQALWLLRRGSGWVELGLGRWAS